MLRPLYAGWYAGDDPWTSIYGPPLRLAEDARRLDISPAWLAWTGTVAALELLAEVGIAAIQRHDLALANALRERFGLPPGDSAIVTVAAEGGLERLRAAGIKASVRAGAVRLSFHLHNTDADVNAVARALGRSSTSRDPYRPLSSLYLGGRNRRSHPSTSPPTAWRGEELPRRGIHVSVAPARPEMIRGRS